MQDEDIVSILMSKSTRHSRCAVCRAHTKFQMEVQGASLTRGSLPYCCLASTLVSSKQSYCLHSQARSTGWLEVVLSSEQSRAANKLKVLNWIENKFRRFIIAYSQESRFIWDYLCLSEPSSIQIRYLFEASYQQRNKGCGGVNYSLQNPTIVRDQIQKCSFLE